MGTGGAPEGVLAAAALRCVGGQMQGRLLFRNDDEVARAPPLGHRGPRPHLHARGHGQGRLHLRRDRGHRRIAAEGRAPPQGLRDDRKHRHAREHRAPIRRVSTEYRDLKRPRASRPAACARTYIPPMAAALNIERSVTGQPWRWRRPPETGLGMDALVDELLLARGVERDDLARHRDPTNPRLPARPVAASRTWTRARSGSPTRFRAARRSPSSAIMTSTARPARRCWCCCFAGSARSRWSTSPTG